MLGMNDWPSVENVQIDFCYISWTGNARAGDGCYPLKGPLRPSNWHLRFWPVQPCCLCASDEKPKPRPQGFRQCTTCAAEATWQLVGNLVELLSLMGWGSCTLSGVERSWAQINGPFCRHRPLLWNWGRDDGRLGVSAMISLLCSLLQGSQHVISCFDMFWPKSIQYWEMQPR